MSKIHFVGGEKGGVGKSVLARLLAQYHIDQGLPFAAFDTDRSHGALLRFYADYSQPMVLDDFESTDQLMESALETDRDILVDLAAQTSLPLHRWIDQNDFLSLADEVQVQIVFWHVLDDGADAIALLDHLFKRYDRAAAYVVVKNYGRGKNFSAYEASAARLLAREMGAAAFDLPDLHAATMRKIDHGSASLWAAAHTKDSGLGLMDRQRVKVWKNRIYQQFNQVSEGLFTPAPTVVPDVQDGF
ncbi:mobilization protein [uncultured Thiocystis sp.]|uniref:mobilization protein n=1 Tax=uncultured Thiocystis sp. TaxID=1202134 RepID=UPI0025FAAFA6|nr:mobilization protein [uncultured Thiocystis sp.]